MKKAQVTLFIIIAVIMLAAFGFGFYSLIQSNRANAGADYYASTKFSFDSDTNVLNAQIQSCLADKTRDGLDYFGLKEGISEQMIENLISASMEDCVDFSYFESRGYQIDRENPYTEVEINDYTVFSTLTYPVEIKKGSRFASLERFEFGIPREKDANLGEDGIADEDLFIVTEDNGAEFFIPEGIQALDASGNPISKVKVKVQDRNVNGLANRVVVGNAIYEGLPSGATFSPALEVKFNVKYGDKPMYMDPKNMMCAYYDEGSDIWRTYMTLGVVDNGPLEKTYTVKCLVEHFTLMAVVNCGATEYKINLEPLFVNPIVVELDGSNDVETFAETNLNWWFKNSDGDNYRNKGGKDVDGIEGLNGIHLYPEIMEKSTCILDRSVLSTVSNTEANPATPGTTPAPAEPPVEEPPGQESEDSGNINSIAATHLYSGNEKGTPWSEHKAFSSEGQEEEYCNDYLLQDWDADDDPEKGNPQKIPESLNVKYLLDCGEKTADDDAFKQKCYELCRIRAMEGEEINALMAKYPGIDKSLLITGDGINDYLIEGGKSLYCLVNDEVPGGQPVGGNTKPKTFPVDYNVNDIKDCLLYEDEIDGCTTKPDGMPRNNLKPKTDGGFQYVFGGAGEATPFTMEWPIDTELDNRQKAFYATPKTWGYARTKATEELTFNDYKEDLNEQIGKIVLGGYGEFFFSLNSDGNACQNIDTTASTDGEPTTPNPEKTTSVGVSIENPYRLEASPALVFRNNKNHIAKPVTINKNTDPEVTGLDICSDNCIWTLNDPIALGQLAGVTVGLGGEIITGTPAEGTETTKITVGQLKSGWNSLRVYVNNLADQPPGTLKKDPVFYASGTLSFIGMGFASEDECGTTLADRMEYLIKAGDGTFYDGNYNAEGKEANCLFTYAKLFNNKGSWKDDTTRLCGGEDNVNFQNPEFLGKAGMGYCACIAYSKGGAGYGKATDSATVRCEAACDANNADPEKQTKCKTYCGGCTSFTEISPNGGKCDISAEGATTCACPDRLDSSRDANCMCGKETYDLAKYQGEKYCCAGQITDTMSGGCRNGNMDVCCCKIAGGGDCQTSNSGSCNPTSEFKFAVDNPIFCDINIGGCKKDEPVQGLPQGSFSQVYCIDSTGRYGCGWDQKAHTWSPSGKWTLMEDCSACDETGRCVTDSNGEEVLPPTDTDCPTDVVLTATGNNGNPNYWIGEGDGHLCQCNKDVFNPNPTSGDINKKCCPFDEGEKFKDSCDKPASDTTCPIGQKLDQSTNYGCTCKGNENIWNNNPYSFCCANDEEDPGFKLSTDGTTSPCTSTGGPGEEQAVPDSCDASHKCTKEKPICCKTIPQDITYSCKEEINDCNYNFLKQEGNYGCPTNEDLSDVTECMCGGAKKSDNGNMAACCYDNTNHWFAASVNSCPGTSDNGGSCANNIGTCLPDCGTEKLDITQKLSLNECKANLECCIDNSKTDEVCCKSSPEYKLAINQFSFCNGKIDVYNLDECGFTGISEGDTIRVPCCTAATGKYCSYLGGTTMQIVDDASDCTFIPDSTYNSECEVCNHQKSNSDTCELCIPYLATNQYYCNGVETSGSPDPGLNTGVKYPLTCKVCGDPDQDAKSDNLYTCSSSHTWEKVDCPNGCRDIGDCKAECYEDSDFCKGTTRGTVDPGLDGEYPVGCKMCGSVEDPAYKADNIYTCNDKGIWEKDDCPGLFSCDHSLPTCYQDCR